MQTRQLGHSDLEITRLGLGAPASPGFDDDDTLRAMARAHDEGVNWVDAGDTPRSEELVGDFLATLGDGGRPYVFARGIGDPAFIKRSVEDTLRRLRVEAIDLYQVELPSGDSAEAQVVQALAALKTAGKIHHVGVCNLPIVALERINAHLPIAAVQCHEPLHAGPASELAAFCQRHNIGVLNTPPSAEPLGETLEAIAEEHHVEPQAVALAWALRDTTVTGALVEAQTPAQMEQMLVAARLKLSVLDVARIDERLSRNR